MGKKFDSKETQLDKQLNYHEVKLKEHVGLNSINFDPRSAMTA